MCSYFIVLGQVEFFLTEILMRCCFEQNRQQQNDVQLFIAFEQGKIFRGREPVSYIEAPY